MAGTHNKCDKELDETRQGKPVQTGEGQQVEYSKVFTPLQVHFLNRLERLLALKNSYETDPHREKWVMDAINRAIYSTLRDCIEQGVGEEAKAIIRREHRAN